MVELSYVDHGTFVADVIAIADALMGDAWAPDHIVGIGRGGLVPATYLSHRTGIPLLTIDHSSSVHSFRDALLRPLAQITQVGGTVLLVDDINDSGGTIEAVRAALTGNDVVPGQVRVAVLIENVRSIARVDYSSRSIDRHSDKRWFVFPWEAMAGESNLIADAQQIPARLG